MFPYYNTPFEIYQKKLCGEKAFMRRFVLRCVPADYTVRGSIRFFRPLSRGRAFRAGFRKHTA